MGAPRQAGDTRWNAFANLLSVSFQMWRQNASVEAVLRPSTASSTGPRRGSDVLVTILDHPGAVVTRVGGRERREYD